MKTVDSVRDLIGNTPLLRLHRVEAALGLEVELFAKIEAMNPNGSVKDRIARQMILSALNDGLITTETTIIEPTSGNTGIGLASVCASLGMRVILTMPETMSIERRSLLKALGATLVLTPGNEGMRGAIARAQELSETIDDTWIPSQFENIQNPQAHLLTTGPEIWSQVEGDLDYFIAGVGTGGTITGVGSFLKDLKPSIQVIAVEPQNSQVLQGMDPKPHMIQGIGAGFVPAILNMSMIDEIVSVGDQEAMQCARMVARNEGILVGVSSGAALAACLKIVKEKQLKGQRLVMVFPDTGERYLSTPLFEEE